MDTFLAPIEQPKPLMLKLIYFFSKKQYGKVLTPLKVLSARLPMAFTSFMGKISQLDKKLQLSEELIFLIRQKVANINICTFCIDISRWMAIHKSMNMEKFHALNDYQDNPLFSDAEKSVFDYVTELTIDKKVKSETFSRMAQYFTDRQICEIVYVVASEHVYNISNIGLNIHTDMLCEIPK